MTPTLSPAGAAAYAAAKLRQARTLPYTVGLDRRTHRPPFESTHRLARTLPRSNAEGDAADAASPRTAEGAAAVARTTMAKPRIHQAAGKLLCLLLVSRTGRSAARRPLGIGVGVADQTMRRCPKEPVPTALSTKASARVGDTSEQRVDARGVSGGRAMRGRLAGAPARGRRTPRCLERSHGSPATVGHEKRGFALPFAGAPARLTLTYDRRTTRVPVRWPRSTRRTSTLERRPRSRSMPDVDVVVVSYNSRGPPSRLRRAACSQLVTST